MWSYISALLFSLQILISAQPYRHSTAGEYYVEWKEIGPCPPEKRGTNDIFINIHLTRRHRRPEAVGNVTVNVTFDDTTPLRMNFAILGSNSAWLPNAYSIKFDKGCSEGLVGMLRDGWLDYMKSFNMTPGCPMPKGYFETNGYYVDNFLKNSLLPKTFFYGRYKVSMDFFNKHDDLIGCVYFIIDVLPIWQKKKGGGRNT